MLDLLRPLAVFTTVAECGSFRAAADRLDLSASVVSHHVTKLEDRYGVALLYRSTRQLSLTAEGKALLQYGRKLLEAGTQARDLLEADLSEPRGLLVIAVAAMLEDSHFMDDVAAFRRLYPKVALRLDFSDKKRDLIRDGYDLAIRIGALDDSELIAQRLTHIDDVFCATPAFIAEHGQPSVPEDLHRFPLIRATPAHDTALLTHRTNPQNSVTLALSHVIHVNTSDAALSLMLRGAGITKLPRLVTETRPAGDIVELLPDWEMPTVDLHALWHKNTGRNSLARLFVNHLLSILRAKEKAAVRGP